MWPEQAVMQAVERVDPRVTLTHRRDTLFRGAAVSDSAVLMGIAE
jgi:hypothetical protein